MGLSNVNLEGVKKLPKSVHDNIIHTNTQTHSGLLIQTNTRTYTHNKVVFLHRLTREYV